MASGLDPNLPLPTIIETPFIIPFPASSAIEFAGFKVDHTEPQPQHLSFIHGVYVPFLIKQIDALQDPRMTTLTLHVRGMASATGKSAHNDDLSVARARAIGAAIQKEFDLQKTGSAFARGVSVEIDAKGLGDRDARAMLDAAKKAHPGVRFTNKAIDGVQGNFRSAFLSLKLIEHPPDTDRPTYQARQIFVFNLKKEKVPVNQLVDEIERLKQENPTIAMVFGVLLDELKEGVKEFLKALEDSPITFLILEALEFIVPGDVAQCFDFKDPRGIQATYSFFGNENKKSLSILGAIAKIFKIAKFLDKVLPIVKRLEKTGKLLGRFLAIKRVFDTLLKDATSKNSPVRRVLGDANTELLILLLKDQGDPGDFALIPTSGFFPFQFKKPGFFEVHSFGSFAQTVSHDLFLASELTLSFGATDLTGISGFEAEVTITTDFSIRNDLLSFGIAHGRLTLMPQIHP